MDPSPVQDRPADPIERDLYCLYCGYNLRGLSGDPVRCPECGRTSLRRELLRQFGATDQRFKDLQTALDAQALALLAGLAFAAATVSATFAVHDLRGLVCLGGLLLLMAAIGAGTVAEVRRLAKEPGWLRPLTAYQMATVGLLAVLPGVWGVCAGLLWSIWRLAGWDTMHGLVPAGGALVLTVALALRGRLLPRLRRRQERYFKELIRLTRAGSTGEEPKPGESLQTAPSTASLTATVQHDSPYNLLVARFAAALAQLAGTPPEQTEAHVRPAGDAKFGDYQCNAAMVLARTLKAKPRDIAERIKAAVEPQLAEIAEPLEIAGPGFINVRLKDEFLAKYLGDIAAPAASPQTDRVGIPPIDRPRRVVVEYSQPNIAKQMHVGHLRSTILGDVFARVLAFLGHEVVRQNHIGDWGTQFGMLIRWYREHPLPTPQTHADVLEAIEQDYKAANERFQKDEPFAAAARRAVAELQGGDPEARRLWEQICAVSLDAIEETYKRLRVLLSAEDVRGESFYNDRLAPLVGELRAKLAPRSAGVPPASGPEARAPEAPNAPTAVVREDARAVVVYLYDAQGQPLFKNQDGEILGMIVQKSDGAFLYATTDLAAIRFRLAELPFSSGVGAERVIYVTDARQKLHFQMFFATARAAGWIGPQVSVEHVTFGSVLGEDRRPLKARAGAAIKLRELLDEAEKRTLELLTGRDAGTQGQRDEGNEETAPAFAAAERREIARRVGIAAVKYADLRNDRNADYVFSWDKMLALTGNTAPYMMYAYARIRSIYRKAAERFGSPDVYAPHVRLALLHPAERAIALRLAGLRDTLDTVAADLTPHVLCTYLYELATDFMRFYENCPVLQAPEEATRLSRMRLCDLTARTLKLGLWLLGIEVIERM